MRAKSWVLLLIALGCGLVASVGISQVVLENRNQQTGTPTVEILVMAKDVSAQTKITAEFVKLEQWPQDRVPEGAITDITNVENKFTNQRLFAGEPILAKKINDEKTGLSGQIPDGFRVFNLKADNATYIRPGDHVDVYGFFEKSRGAPSNKTMKVIEDIEVLAVDGIAIRDGEDEGGGNAKYLQLLIKDSQYEAMFTASNLGKLNISLRNPGDSKTLSQDGEEFMIWVESANTPEVPNAAPQPSPSVLVSAQPPQNTEKKKQVVVVTPNGIQKFEWSDDSTVPRLVDDSDDSGVASTGVAPASNPSNYVWDPISGQYTTGGMVPQYPSAPSSTSGAMNPAGGGTEED